jgi:hypothetical protein
MCYSPIAMTELDYVKMYQQLADQHAVLFQERIDLEVKLGDVSKQLESIQQTMAHLAPLAGFAGSEFDEFVTLGITDAVRAALNPSQVMSPAEIKGEMERRGYDLSKYSAPDATIRTILKRLVDAGKAEQEKDGHKIFYKWIPTDDEIPF